MNEVQIFNNAEFGEIRTIAIEGEPWFVGVDVAKALGYTNTRKALHDHVDTDEKSTVTKRDGIKSPNGATVINESGLYSLIFASQLPTAKKFKRWVTSEVLPSIRKTGAYGTYRNEVIGVPELKPSTLEEHCQLSQYQQDICSAADRFKAVVNIFNKIKCLLLQISANECKGTDTLGACSLLTQYSNNFFLSANSLEKAIKNAEYRNILNRCQD